jgi:hypothetical protein
MRLRRVVLPNEHAAKHAHPERPSGVRDLSSHAAKHAHPERPSGVRDLSSHAAKHAHPERPSGAEGSLPILASLKSVHLARLPFSAPSVNFGRSALMTFSLSPTLHPPHYPPPTTHLTPLECAVLDKYRVLPGFGRSCPYVSPLECAVPKNAPVSLLECADAKKVGGEGE